MLALLLLLPAADYGYPVDVAIAADGQRWVADRTPPAVWQGETRLGGEWRAVQEIAAFGNQALVADTARRGVFEAGGRRVADVVLPVAIATDGRRLWVADATRETLAAVSVADGETLASVPRRGLRGLAWTGDELLALTADGEVQSIDPGTLAATTLFRADLRFPADLCAVGDRIAISDSYAGRVALFARDGSPAGERTDPSMTYPVGLAYADGTLLVADPKARKVFALPIE